jgi:mannan endo-1,4-beta-mannosidase
MFTRRDILRTGAVTGSVGVLGASADGVGAETAPEYFVETDGTEFVVDGDPYYFNGTNNYVLSGNYTGREYVSKRMADYERVGLTLVRTWAFCSGEDGGDCEQPSPREYNEAAFRQLDYIIKEAGEHGIRLVMPFTNYWGDYGGMDQYVEWSSTAESREDFYDDNEAQAIFKDYIEYVLERENHFTGVTYKNDPTIAMWELANEPRAKYRSDGLSVLQAWMEDVSAHIKSIDSNHLVCSGMEGFYDQPNNDDYPDNWRFDGSHGTRFIDNHEISDIDVCSLHLYPKHWGQSKSQALAWIQTHVDDAHQTVGKPVYLGEFGWQATDQSTREERVNVYTDWYDEFGSRDGNAASVWQYLGTSNATSEFAIHQDDDAADVIMDFSKTQKDKTAGTTNDAPSPAFTLGDPTPSAGAPVEFDADATVEWDGQVTSYEWSFGDGATATGETVTHTFDSDGEYTVSLTVTDDDGATASTSRTITVTPSDTERFTDELADGSKFANDPSLYYKSKEFVHADGSEDTTQVERGSGTRNSPEYLEYEVDGSVASVRVEAQFDEYHDDHTDIAIEESTDGGDSWSGVDAVQSQYDQVDKWLHYEFTATGFSDGVSRVRVKLTHSDGGWTPKVGFVEINYQPGSAANVFTDELADGSKFANDPSLYYKSKEFVHADGSEDTTQVERGSGTRNSPEYLEYEVDGSVASVRVEAQFDEYHDDHTDIAIEESTDGGDSWSEVDAVQSQYDQVGKWLHYEFTADEFSDGTEHVRVKLTHSDGGWTPKVGFVEIEYGGGGNRGELVTDDCSDLDDLVGGSDTGSLTVDSSNASYFQRPGGDSDDGRIARSGTTGDAALVYEPGGQLLELTAEFHSHKTAEGELDVYESTDGGDSWTQVGAYRDAYGGTDAFWRHWEVGYDAFATDANRVKLVLTGGSKEWSGQLGNVAFRVLPNETPSAAFGLDPAEPFAGQTVGFDAGDSADSDGEIASYAWDFGDGTTATGEAVDHVFDQPGEYTVSLTVTDQYGASATAEKTVTVTPGVVASVDALEERAHPSAHLELAVEWSATDRQGSLASADLTVTDLDDDEVVGTWEYSLDGSEADERVETRDKHDDGANHEYEAEVTVTDEEGRTNTATETMTAGTNPPTATIDSLDASGSSGPHATVEADWTVTDPDGDLDSAEITIRDRTDDETLTSKTFNVQNSEFSKTTKAKAKHEDGAGHTYAAELTATDENGHSDSTTETVDES